MPDRHKLAEYVANAESIDAGKLEEMGFSAIADLARNASVDRSFLLKLINLSETNDEVAGQSACFRHCCPSKELADIAERNMRAKK